MHRRVGESVPTLLPRRTAQARGARHVASLSTGGKVAPPPVYYPYLTYITPSHLYYPITHIASREKGDFPPSLSPSRIYYPHHTLLPAVYK